MSKLIIEMEMPRNCQECPLCHAYFLYGSKYCGANGVLYEKEHYKLKRPEQCPIIGELPEQHGDLVDRDALLETCQELFEKREKEQIFTGNRGPCVTWNDAIYHIKSATTVDAVPVVRCGKCGLRYKPLDDDVRNEIYCEFIGSTMRKDDFCSYGCADGERKDDADNR